MSSPAINPPPGADRFTTPADSASAPNSHSGAQPRQAEHPLWGFAKRMGPYVSELRTYFAYWMSAQRDRAKLKLRNIAIMAALGVIGLIALATVIVYAVIMLMGSLGMGLAELFGLINPRLMFLGPLLLGAIVLAGLGWGMMFAMNKVFGLSHTKTQEKYDAQRTQQRVRFGHDVSDRASQAPQD